MKLALLLPGFLDSPDYLHMVTFDKELVKMGYTVERLDLGGLWKSGKADNYLVTNFISEIRARIELYAKDGLEEVLLLGHSRGAFTSIVAGSMIPEVTRIVALCPPPDIKASAKKWPKDGNRVSSRDLPENSEMSREFAIPHEYVEDSLKYSAVESAKELHKPLMIFIALNDVVVAPELTEEIVLAAKNPHVVREPNIGHDFRRSPQDIERVWDRIKNFLEQ
jgi:pimeloyl-ACP methyl ester carboxylesterase